MRGSIGLRVLEDRIDLRLLIVGETEIAQRIVRGRRALRTGWLRQILHVGRKRRLLGCREDCVDLRVDLIVRQALGFAVFQDRRDLRLLARGEIEVGERAARICEQIAAARWRSGLRRLREIALQRGLLSGREDVVDLLLDLRLREPLAVAGLQDRADLFALVFGQIEVGKRPERGARGSVRLRRTAEETGALNSIAQSSWSLW